VLIIFLLVPFQLASRELPLPVVREPSAAQSRERSIHQRAPMYILRSRSDHLQTHGTARRNIHSLWLPPRRSTGELSTSRATPSQRSHAATLSGCPMGHVRRQCKHFLGG